MDILLLFLIQLGSEFKDEIEKKGIKLALNKAENVDLNIIVIEPKSADFADFFNDKISKKSILVINKMDLGIDQINNEENMILFGYQLKKKI